MSYRHYLLIVARYCVLVTLLTLCWAALSGGRGWWFFLPLCLLVMLWCYLAKLSLPTLRLRALPAFLGFFSRQLVLGAFDVAWRALAPKARMAPQWQRYPLRLRHPASQQLLASLVSLLPGTCSVNIATEPDNLLLLHVLDANADWQSSVTALEQHLARLLYNEALPAATSEAMQEADL